MAMANTDEALVVFQNDRIRVWRMERKDWFEVFDRIGLVYYGNVYATPCGSFAATSARQSVPSFHPTFFDAVEAL